MRESALRQIIAKVQDHRQQKSRISIRGSGSHDGLLGPPPCDVLDTQAYQGVVCYDPDELYIKVLSGTCLSDLVQILGERNQMLSFEPPCYTPSATVGGMVATGLAGPRRMVSGPLRDSLLGIRVLDGLARILNLGGTVIKNVAGYDVSRIYAGSMGALGVILEVTLRVYPRPRHSVTLKGEILERDFLSLMGELRQSALALDASAYLGGAEGTFWLRLQGSPGAVELGCHQLRSRLNLVPLDPDEARIFWEQISLKSHPLLPKIGGDDGPLWRLSLPPHAPSLQHAGITLIEWRGGLRWLWGLEEAQAHSLAHASGGWASRFGWSPDASSCWPRENPDPVKARLIRGIEQRMDPEGIFHSLISKDVGQCR